MKNYCVVCFKLIQDKSLSIIINKDICLCFNCLKKMKPKFKLLTIDSYKELGLYEYDGMIKDLLFQYKGCGDIALRNVFFCYFSLLLRIVFINYIIVPVPSYYLKDEKRGFNHVEEMYKIMHKRIYKCIKKTKDIKQSERNYQERKKVKDYFAFVGDKTVLFQKKVLIVDDVLTTSMTMRACIDLIRQCNPKKILFLVMSYTCRKNYKFDD